MGAIQENLYAGQGQAIVFWQLASSLVFCPNKKARAKILDESSFLSCQVAAGPRSAEDFPAPFRYCVCILIQNKRFTVVSGSRIGHERIPSREFSALVCELLFLGASRLLLKSEQVFNSQPNSQTRGLTRDGCLFIL